MKSSSRYFPVRLMVAEQTDGLAEDVYLLKPNTSEDKTVELAVTHLSPLEASTAPARSRPVLILLHGEYQNRGVFWRGADASLGRQLVQAGVDVWLMESRGHGLSAINSDFDVNTLADAARFDIPAVTRFVAEMTGERAVHWLGVGTGAGALLMAEAAGALQGLPVASIVGCGDPFGSADWASLPGIATLVAGRKCRNELAGPEVESHALMKNLIVESRKLSQRGASIDVELWDQLSSSRLPLAWLSADNGHDWSERGLRNLQQQGNLRVLDVTRATLEALSMGQLGGEQLSSLPRLLAAWMTQQYRQEMVDGISGAGEVAPFA